MVAFKKDKNIVEKVAENHEVREVFRGRRTLFSLTGFIVGGVLFANGVWELLHAVVPVWAIMLMGIVLFVFGGVISHSFRK